MNNELKPCPFCGGKSVIKAVNKNYGLTISATNVVQEPRDIA